MPSNPKKKMCQAFKVIVIGDSGVGKTSFLHRMADIDAPSSHVRKDYLSKVAVVKSAIAPVKVQLWDTAGQEKFGAARLPSSFFRHADAAIVVYDVTDRRSFTNVLRWVGQIQVHQVASVGNSAFSLILVGHKSDVSNAAREVHEEEGPRSPTLKVLAAKSKAPTITAPYIGTLAVLLSMPMVLLWLDDDAVFRWAEAMGLQ
uniref:Uncharacterized protein n=1 Tax=Phytophthora ramorum TaxID=164328 RepID=H3HBM9_PHYRM